METLTDADVARAGGPKRVREIDTLRALAMIAVVAEHAKIFSIGWIGVWLFYVISGYVVTGSVTARAGGGPRWKNAIAFYLRRSARIWPIYFLVIIVATLVSYLFGHNVPWLALASLCGFYNNFALAMGFGETPAFNTGHLWTISVEMQFYLVYGFVIVVCGRKAAAAFCAAAIVLCPLGRLLLSVHLVRSHIPVLSAAFDVYSFSFLHFDAFSAGCLIALYQHSLTKRIATTFMFSSIAIFLAYCLTYVFVNIHLGAHGVSSAKNVISGILFGQYREVWLYDAIFLVAAALIAMIRVDALRFASLSSTSLQRIGETSYGAYVYHLPCLSLSFKILAVLPLLHRSPQRFVERGAAFVIALVLTLALAELSFRYLETPLSRAANRIIRNIQGRDGVLAVH